MENQKTGFIPLYRSVLKQTWSKDVFLRTLWENLLLCAARQPYTANFKGRQWPLQTGQLVTTSADLGLNLCDREGKPCSRHAVERQLTHGELAREAGDLLDMWEKRVTEGKPVPPVRRAIAAPAAEHGPTPIQLLQAKYNRNKSNGMV